MARKKPTAEDIKGKWESALQKKLEIDDIEFTLKELGDEKREISTRIRSMAQDLSIARKELMDLLK